MLVHASAAYPFPAGACKFSRPCSPCSFKEKDVALAAARQLCCWRISCASSLHRFAGTVAAQICRQAFQITSGPAHICAGVWPGADPWFCRPAGLTCKPRACSCAWCLMPMPPLRADPPSALLRPYIYAAILLAHAHLRPAGRASFHLMVSAIVSMRRKTHISCTLEGKK